MNFYGKENSNKKKLNHNKCDSTRRPFLNFIEKKSFQFSYMSFLLNTGAAWNFSLINSILNKTMGKGQQQQLITTKLESVEGLHFNSAIQMCNVDFFTHFSINNSIFSKILDAKKSLADLFAFKLLYMP